MPFATQLLTGGTSALHYVYKGRGVFFSFKNIDFIRKKI